MKKIITVLVFLLLLCGCGQKESTEGNKITELLNEGYEFSGTTFDENEWKGLFSKDDESFIIVKAKMDAKKYEEIEEVFFEEDKYHEALQKLEVTEVIDVSDQLPSEEELQKYVGKKFADLEEEGFFNTGYIESDNYQYNFTYENDILLIEVKSPADIPIYDMDDFSENDIREFTIEEVVYCTLSGSILYNY